MAVPVWGTVAEEVFYRKSAGAFGEQPVVVAPVGYYPRLPAEDAVESG
jgi:hypothetical protein